MVEYNPFSQEVMRDPYPIYERLREEEPTYHIAEYDAWALSRFEDVWNACQDNEHFSCEQGTTSAHLLTKVQPVTPMLNLMDPPEHTELRTALRSHFSPGRVRALEPLMRQLAIDCLEAARERGEIDVMGDFASQVAVKIACTVTGIPSEDGDMLSDLVWRFFKREPGVEGMTPDGLKAMEELGAYFVALAQRRRGSGAREDDVVSLLARTEVGGAQLDDFAIASHLTLLIIGGSETFPKVFANAIRRLHEHRDQRALCIADPNLIPDAFQEVLRYDMPTQFQCRMVIKDLEIHDKSLRTGQPVLLLFPSANRDPREFTDPDVFDIRRRASRILSFGHGTHGCLGIHIAKMEGGVCLEETLKRIPEYEVDLGRAERLVTDFVQGYASLPVTF
jgi:cytochrome P450